MKQSKSTEEIKSNSAIGENKSEHSSRNDIDKLKLKEIENIAKERIQRSQKMNDTKNLQKSNVPQRDLVGNEIEDNYIDLSNCISKKVSLKDFNIIKLVGKGSFGKVFLVTTKENSNFFAMKALKKDVILQDDDVECTMLERDVCKLGNKNPYLTKLFCTFQNDVSFNLKSVLRISILM